MRPPPAVGLEHGRFVRITGHVQDVPDHLRVVQPDGIPSSRARLPRAGARHPSDPRRGCAGRVRVERAVSPAAGAQGGRRPLQRPRQIASVPCRRQVQPRPSRPSVDPWRALPRSIPRGRVRPRAAYRPGDRRLADRPRALSSAGNLRPVRDRRHPCRRGRRSPPGSPLAAALTLRLAPRLSAAVARPAPPPQDGIWLGRRSPPPTPERAGRQGAPVSHARHRALTRVIWCGVRQDTRMRSGLATMIAIALAREVATFSRCPS